MKKLLSLFLVILTIHSSAQVAIYTDNSLPDNSAMLDIKSTAQGTLIPKMTQAQRNTIASPAAGLMIFQSDISHCFLDNAFKSLNLPVTLIFGSS